MTLLELVLPYEPLVGERELSSLNAMHDVYGIRAVKFNQGMNTVTVEYDTSRLTKAISSSC